MIEFPDRVNSSAVLESLDCQRQVNFQCTGGVYISNIYCCNFNLF